jgi:hypothetical protein
MAAIAAAPSNLLIMLLTIFVETDPNAIAEIRQRIDRRSHESLGMNFMREIRDQHAAQMGHAKHRFSITAR